jgi:hypothetical protein
VLEMYNWGGLEFVGAGGATIVDDIPARTLSLAALSFQFTFESANVRMLVPTERGVVSVIEFATQYDPLAAYDT